MRSRLASMLAAFVTISIVVFGQVCAIRGIALDSGDAPAATAASDHAQTCTPETCGGGDPSGDAPECPSTSCCSTWGPPTIRAALLAPEHFVDVTPMWLTVFADGADATLLLSACELARPPCPVFAGVHVSSRSHRGPPVRA